MRSPRVPRALFDWLTVRRSLAIVVIVGGTYAGHAWTSYRHDGTDAARSILGWAPVVVFLLAAPLISLCVHGFGWADERARAPWQGRYHAFDDHQIRLVEARGALWFCSADVHAALRVRSRPGILKSLRTTEVRRDDALGSVLSNAGLVTLFGRSTDRLAVRFLAWAERDVRQPWQRRRDAAATVPPPSVS